LMAAWSMMRWQSSGQSCISPSMASPRGVSLSLRLPARGPHATVESSAGCARQGAEPCKAKPRDIVPGRSRRGEIGEDLADHRGELESVPGAGGGDDDIGRAGVSVDQEIAVGSHSIEAGFGADHSAIGGGNVIGDGWADQRLIVRRNGSIVMVGVHRLVAMVVLGDLDAGSDVRRSVRRNAVMHAVATFDDED